MIALDSLTIRHALGLLRQRKISAVELTRAVLDRLAATEKTLQAFITLCEKEALIQAQKADQHYSTHGPYPPLLGIPIAVKDVIITKGIRSTAGSKILSNFIPPYDATVTQKLKEAGAVLVGKTNCDEFAMGSSTENSGFFPTRNPWNPKRVPGGSSGGSAAAVAASQVLASLGTDTGGSIRLPASFCGVVGLKPTYGRVSRFGVIAYASSLDQVGPLTKSVWDCARMLEVIAGHDSQDSTSIDAPIPSYTSLLSESIKGRKVGVPQEYLIPGIQPEVQEAVQKALRVLETLGARVEEVSLPHTPYAVSTYYILATAEASSNLARYDGVRYGYRAPQSKDLLDLYCSTRSQGFGKEVKRRIMLGTYALSAGYYSAYYLKAQKVRNLIRQDFLKALTACDALVTPVAPTTAFRLGEKLEDPLTMYLSDIFTIPANLAGLPALSLPCGQDHEGLPIGLQMIGRPLGEDTLLGLAYAYEQATPWHALRPPL